MRHALALVTVATLVACTPSPSASDAGVDAFAPVDAAVVDAWVPPVPTTTIMAANSVAAGDPMFEGQQRFLYDTWGVEVQNEWPPLDFMMSLTTSEPTVFGDQFASFGFLHDPNDDLPVGFKRGIDDPTLVHETCAMCHVGRLPDGSLWLGMPNLQLDIGRFRYEVNQRWTAAGHPSLLSAADAAKVTHYGPGRTGADTSDYPMAVPVDLPPYWLLGARTATNYLGTGANIRTETFLSLFAFGAGDPTASTLVTFPPSARVDPFVAFMGSMLPPPPPPQDAGMVAAGQAVYARERCGSCHHVDAIAMNGVTTYDRSPTGIERFPGDDPMFPTGTIRTDYLHRILIDGPPPPDAGADGSATDAGPTSDPGLATFLAFISHNHLIVRNSDGYRVDDLHGLWATAPYLHNGSVPTLDALLQPAAMRPTSFMRGTYLVDTTVPGNSNQGHEFGTTINATDRAALVAYLMSL
jgi:hypothetical protein